jgi:hypothetical protein
VPRPRHRRLPTPPLRCRRHGAGDCGDDELTVRGGLEVGCAGVGHTWPPQVAPAMQSIVPSLIRQGELPTAMAAVSASIDSPSLRWRMSMPNRRLSTAHPVGQSVAVVVATPAINRDVGVIRLRPKTAGQRCAVTREDTLWSRLGSNQRLSACEAEGQPAADLADIRDRQRWSALSN